MKKAFKIILMASMMIMLFSMTTFAAKEAVPIVEVAAVDLDIPKPGQPLDTSIELKNTSHSYFMELNWDKRT